MQDVGKPPSTSSSLSPHIDRSDKNIDGGIKSNVAAYSCPILATNNCIIELSVEVIWAVQLVKQSVTTQVNKGSPEPGVRLLQYRIKILSVHIYRYLHAVFAVYMHYSV